jgi:hypothetical protein
VVRKEDVLQVPAAALRFVPPGIQEKPAKGDWKKRSGGSAGGPRMDSTDAGSRPNSADGSSRMDTMGQGGETDSASRSHRREGASQGSWKDSTGRGPRSDSAGGRSRSGHGGWGGKRDRSAGRVWILVGGKPKPVEVRTGLSDGSHTEIEGPLEPGAEVIIGMDTAKPSGPAAQTSPFGMPRIGGGGGGGRGGAGGGGAGGGGGRAH